CKDCFPQVRQSLVTHFASNKRGFPDQFRLLTPTLSSFEEERGNYFVGRLPGVASAARPDPGLLSFAPTAYGAWLGFSRFAPSFGLAIMRQVFAVQRHAPMTKAIIFDLGSCL